MMSQRPSTSGSTRPSTSSARIRRGGPDFEAALRDPSSTLFLSGGPNISAHSPGGPSRKASTRGRASSSRGVDVENGEMDRSFDEDMARLALTPRKGSGSGSASGPSSSMANRHDTMSPTSRISDASGSTTPTRSSRHRPMKSIGLDAEVAQETSPKSTISKKRSLFRSPGTASSPDLATLVKRAKDRGPVGHVVVRPDERGWSGGGGSGSGGGLATISERRGSQEKSVSKKARGMLGRMFGARDPSPRSEPDNPIPPIPATYRRDLSGIPEGLARTITPPHPAPINKPLPFSPSPTPARGSRSHHTRQPAYSPSPNTSQVSLSLSRSNTQQHDSDRPGQTANLGVGDFTDDVNGMFAGIGEVSPAMELGLAPQSVSLSAATGKPYTSPRYQHAELGLDAERTGPDKVPGPRTTSLPSNLQVEINGANRMIERDQPHTNGSGGSAHASGDGDSRRQVSDSGTVHGEKPTLGSPLAPSVRLVPTPRLPLSDPDRLTITTNDIAKSYYAGEDGRADTTPQDRGRELASEFLQGKFSSVPEDKVAEFLGGPKEVNAAALYHYMEFFSMTGNLVECFRELCAKLFLRAESQEIDRIIEAFSARFYQCNPDTVFGSPGVVHTVTGAMLMLNTDLHIADLTKHMSRTDFIRNAMSAIRESMPNEHVDNGDGDEPLIPPQAAALRPHNAQRSASAPVIQPGHGNAMTRVVSEAGALAGPGSSSSLEAHTYSRAWEAEAEAALRDIYNAVRSERILLPINSTSNSNRQSMVSLATSLDSRKPRTPSGAHKRQSVIGRPGGALNSVYADNRSPTGSYATSINETLTPFASIGFASNLSHSVIREHEEELRSTESAVSVSTVDELNDDELALLGAPWAKEGLLSHKLYMESSTKRAKKSDWKQFFTVVQKGELYMFVFGSGSGFSGGSVGGGNWLQNAKPVGTIDLIHCLASALPRNAAGPDRPYCFSLTTSTGQVTLFQAGTDDLVLEWVSTCNYWSARQSRQPLSGGVSNMEYGWQRVAASMTPSNSDNSASTRGVSSVSSSSGLTVPGSPAHTLGVGSGYGHELERRTSKTPSVQNIFGSNGHSTGSPFRRGSAEHDDRASIRSARSGMSKFGLGLSSGTYGRSMGKSAFSNPMDKIHINDWTPPIPALVPGTLDEEAQLEALQLYNKQIRADMDAHKALEDAMNRQYTPGSRNAIKARENWTARAAYIHTEIVKFETYVESLRHAIKERVKQAGERKLERSLMRSNASLSLNGSSSGNVGGAGAKRGAD